jgi:glycosyltransferase involved in cell wall biosynthesis
MRITIIYPLDDSGEKIGGIEKHIRDFLESASLNIEIEVIGITKTLKIGSWYNINFGKKVLKFFPILKLKNPNKRTKIPLIFKYTLSLLYYSRKINYKGSILIFHRIEPSFVLWWVKAKKVLFVHGDVRYFNSDYSESKWRAIRFLYFFLENFFIYQFNKIFTLTKSACEYYKKRYPKIADRFEFFPSWFDEEIFRRYKNLDRENILRLFNIPSSRYLFLYVGRLEKPKNPFLLIDVFYILNKFLDDSRLIIVGEGTLVGKINTKIITLGLEKKVNFLGVKKDQDIALLMNISNLLILVSAFEGMPVVVLEALACGLPVVATKVGEVELVVKEGFSGKVVNSYDPKEIAKSIIEILKNPPDSRTCQKMVSKYSKKKLIKYLEIKLNELAKI